MKSIELLRSLEVVPRSALGKGRIQNKARLLERLARYRRMVTITLVLLYLMAIAVSVVTVALALRTSSSLAKGFIPYVGGAAFVGLLEFARRLTKDWMLMTLPLAVASHASDDQLTELITNLLAGFGKPTDKPK